MLQKGEFSQHQDAGLFDVDIFSVALCVGVTQLVSGFLSEEVAPWVVSASHGRQRFRSLLCHHFVLVPHFLVDVKKQKKANVLKRFLPLFLVLKGILLNFIKKYEIF